MCSSPEPNFLSNPSDRRVEYTKVAPEEKLVMIGSDWWQGALSELRAEQKRRPFGRYASNIPNKVSMRPQWLLALEGLLSSVALPVYRKYPLNNSITIGGCRPLWRAPCASTVARSARLERSFLTDHCTRIPHSANRSSLRIMRQNACTLHGTS